MTTTTTNGEETWVNPMVYGDITPRYGKYCAKGFLKRAVKETIVDKFAQRADIPKNHAQMIEFRRYKPLARVTSPLTEGVTPAGQRMQAEIIQAPIYQYGGVVEFTDRIIDTHEDPFLNETVKALGEQAGESLEAIKIAILKTCTNQYFAGGTSKATVSSKVTKPFLRLINRSLKRNLAKQITSILHAGSKISTEAVGASYILMGHTDLETDFREIPGFLPVEKYGDFKPVSQYEIGKVENFRILLTTMFEPDLATGASGTTLLSGGDIPGSSAAADVYPLIAVGRDAYSFTQLAGEHAAVVSVANPKHTAEDPLAQRGAAGWKTWQGGCILQDLWMGVAWVGCSATY
ncbi:MAG: N4-gp56 family major capsid protein [Lentisphaeria bacterium]|nr:N4-gp56 family major capsid protein [Lentisphaeria bacterium]